MKQAEQESIEGGAPSVEDEPTQEQLIALAVKPDELWDEAHNRLCMVRGFLSTLTFNTELSNVDGVGDVAGSAWGAHTLLEEAMAMLDRDARILSDAERKGEELAKKITQEKESMEPAAIAKRRASYVEFRKGIDELIKIEDRRLRESRKHKGNGAAVAA